MAGSTAAIPELTAEQVQRILVQPLEDASVVLSSGVRIFDTNGSPVRIPKLTGGVSPDWIDENELITDDDATFDEVEFFPSVQAKAARLAYGLVANHPFNDGNKRIGVQAMRRRAAGY